MPLKLIHREEYHQIARQPYYPTLRMSMESQKYLIQKRFVELDQHLYMRIRLYLNSVELPLKAKP